MVDEVTLSEEEIEFNCDNVCFEFETILFTASKLPLKHAPKSSLEAEEAGVSGSDIGEDAEVP